MQHSSVCTRAPRRIGVILEGPKLTKLGDDDDDDDDGDEDDDDHDDDDDDGDDDDDDNDDEDDDCLWQCAAL